MMMLTYDNDSDNGNETVVLEIEAIDNNEFILDSGFYFDRGCFRLDISTDNVAVIEKRYCMLNQDNEVTSQIFLQLDDCKKMDRKLKKWNIQCEKVKISFLKKFQEKENCSSTMNCNAFIPEYKSRMNEMESVIEKLLLGFISSNKLRFIFHLIPIAYVIDYCIQVFNLFHHIILTSGL
uniref:Uncharacterized protein n=1 Tax=Onchocerca volvulus TaxID=6282 RepID=A0A8R1XKY2_ONCVO